MTEDFNDTLPVKTTTTNISYSLSPETKKISVKRINTILTSASKIVFLMIAFTACVSFYAGKLEAKDFMTLAFAAFTFYFSNKGETGSDYAGK